VKRRLVALAGIPLIALLAGCAQVEEAATNAASSAAAEVASVAVEEATRQVCALVEDGMVSAQEQQLLSGLVDLAETAGLPSEFSVPLRQIAGAGDQVPAEAVDALAEACA
jgi:type IV pilus biogenesis protein CpaD/CtpE